jgi:hypothetical protein
MVAGSSPDEVDFFNLANPSSRTMALTEIFPGAEGSRRVSLTTLPPSVREREKMWEPRRLTILWAFTTCYRDSFTFY